MHTNTKFDTSNNSNTSSKVNMVLGHTLRITSKDALFMGLLADLSLQFNVYKVKIDYSIIIWG